MPRFEKWLQGVAADAPADQVARGALAERLLAVSHFLDKSVGGADETEAIHQLRVWTRRSSAALKLFEPALPRSRRNRMKKLLRKMRRTAGAVRDCDIHLDRLNSDDVQAPRRVVRALKRQRRQARRDLKRLRRHLHKDSRLEVQISLLLEKIAWPKRHSSRDAPPFSSFCRQQLTPLAADFFQLAETDLHDNEKLHALRIAGKRLRYALELAPAAMPPRQHQELYESLNEIQDRLGEVCDQLAAIEHIREWLTDVKKRSHRQRLEKLLRREERQLDQLRTRLIRWWSPARRRRLRQHWQKIL